MNFLTKAITENAFGDPVPSTLDAEKTHKIISEAMDPKADVILQARDQTR